MKDLHNHLLYGIDDGPKNIEKSLECLNFLNSLGITEICFTPHFIKGSIYNADNKAKKDIIKSLASKTNIKLYMGNETFLDDNLYEELQKGNLSTLNGSRYLLVEFPLNNVLNNGFDIIFDLRSKGIVPIIAHVERYHYYDFDTFEKLIDMGCLLQGNLTSLTKRYGPKSYYNLKALLKRNMISILATDYHGHTTFEYDKAIKKLDKIVSKEMKDELLNSNFDKIINDDVLESYQIIKKKGHLK